MKETHEIIALKQVKHNMRKAYKNVFPLTPTHRKELRELRQKNVGNLRTRLRVVKDEKRKEFMKLHIDRFRKEEKRCRDICHELDNDWKRIQKTVRSILTKRKNLEKRKIVFRHNVRGDYQDFIFNKRREIVLDSGFIDKISREEFNRKYNERFKFVEDKIQEITDAYEEAINFGDLEMVKKLYYMLKDADEYITKIQEMVVR